MVSSCISCVSLLLIALVDDSRTVVLLSDAVSSLFEMLGRCKILPPATAVSAVPRVAQYSALISFPFSYLLTDFIGFAHPIIVWSHTIPTVFNKLKDVKSTSRTAADLLLKLTQYGA